MKGSHRIIVESRKVKYDFVIHRNITILTGDSGTGKTVLIDLIRDYRRYGPIWGYFHADKSDESGLFTFLCKVG